MEATGASNLSVGEGGKHTAGRDGAIMRLCDVPLLCKLQLPYLSNSAAPVVLRVPPALTVLATLVAADQVRGANLGRKRIMAVVWLARARASNTTRAEPQSHACMCRCETCQPKPKRLGRRSQPGKTTPRRQCRYTGPAAPTHGEGQTRQYCCLRRY